MEYLVAISFVLMSLVTVYSLIKLNTRLWIMLIVVPYLVFTTGFGFMVYNTLKGYATTEPIPAESEFLFGAVAQPKIYVLVNGDQGLRLHVMPYSEFTRREVDRGNQLVEEGKKVQIETTGTSTVPRVHEFDHKKLMPKNPNNN